MAAYVATLEAVEPPHREVDMAKTKRAKDTWRGHELITKAIFEALLKQSNPEQWEITHNTKVVGLTATHQIDVFWRFRVADLEHIVIVQVKKEKGRTKTQALMPRLRSSKGC